MSIQLHPLNGHTTLFPGQGQQSIYLSSSGSISGNPPLIDHRNPTTKPSGTNQSQQVQGQYPKTESLINNSHNHVNNPDQARTNNDSLANNARHLLLDRQITDGKILQAKVIEAKVLAIQSRLQLAQSTFKITLQISDQLIESTSKEALAVGSLIKLKIINNKELQILSILPLGDSNTISKFITNSMRLHLPMQNNIGSLIKQFLHSTTTSPTSRSSTSPTSTSSATTSSMAASSLKDTTIKNQKPPSNQLSQLPARVEKLVADYIGKIPQAMQVTTGKSLQQTFYNSGIFLEHKLASALSPTSAKTTTPINSNLSLDQKGNLLQLLKNLLPLAVNSETNASHQLKIDQSMSMTEILKTLTQQASLLNQPRGKNLSGSAIKNVLSGNLVKEFSSIKDLTLTKLMGKSTNMNSSEISPAEKQDNSILNLLKLIIGSVARTQLQQTQHIQQQANPEPGLINSWLTDIPVKTPESIDLFQTHIEEYDGKDAEDEQQNAKLFKVTLAFDLFPLGPMYVQIKYHHNKVATVFWAENPNTLLQVRNELKLFNKALEDKGIIVDKLQCKQGSPMIKATKLEQHLVDINVK